MQCKHCNIQMKPGKAILQTYTGLPDFPGKEMVTMSPGGPGKLVDCLKCPKCGFSVTKEGEMMNNKRLLELAAKAAGVEGSYVEGYGAGDYYYTDNQDGILCESQDGQLFVWNPLEDDGDALRLAVKLDMIIHVDHYHCHCIEVTCDHNIYFENLGEGIGPYAATRRAIVKAAAAIADAESCK
jgi:hypothetical protein